MNIKSPIELGEAVEIWKKKPTQEIVMDIARYKWYNVYCNIHIKADSPEDKHNILLCETIERYHPDLHASIEKYVDYLIEKIYD